MPEAKVKTIKAGGYEYQTSMPIPAAARGPRASSETAEKLKNMPLGASFLEPVDPAPENVKDEAEREKVFKENARAVANRLSGAVRRFKKANPDYEFVMRVVSDDDLGTGVRVWRIEPAKDASGDGAKGEATAT